MPPFFVYVVTVVPVAAEVCDKIDEYWQSGSGPVSLLPFGGLPLFLNSWPVWFFAATILLLIPVWIHRIGTQVILPLMAVWIGLAILFGPIAYLTFFEDDVSRSAIAEGCWSDTTSGIELPILCLCVAISLWILRRRIRSAVKTETSSHE